MSWHLGGSTSSRATARRSARAGPLATGPAVAPRTATCFGVLSWLVEEGHADEVELRLAAAFTIRYDDDKPGSPRSFVVHVDERGSEEQREALADSLLGRRGGDDILRQP
jgi:hypothetical protein